MIVLAPWEWRLRWWDRSLWWRTCTPGGYDGYRTIGGRKLPCATMAQALRQPELHDEIRRISRMSLPRLARRLHRNGIARILNSGSNGITTGSRCTAYIEARGPRWLAIRLARYALRHSLTAPKPDWRTICTDKEQQPGRWHWRFLVAYRRP